VHQPQEVLASRDCLVVPNELCKVVEGPLLHMPGIEADICE
jgi:hypothetical protein